MKKSTVLNSKKRGTSRPLGEATPPKLKVEKKITNERVDEIAKEVAKFSYGQCLRLKIDIDRRLSTTRARQ